jgi:integrase
MSQKVRLLSRDKASNGPASVQTTVLTKPIVSVLHHDRTALRYKAGDRIKSLYDGYRRAAERAKLPDRLTQHDLRHRRVTEWLAEGKSPVLVKEAMGHSDIRTTMGYTHLAKEHLRSLVDPPVAKRDEAVS